MSSKVVKTKILQRIDTEENWNNINPILLNGEIAFVKTENSGIQMKVGNGSNYQNTPFQTNISIDKIPSLDFNIEHISQDEYYNLVVNDNVDKNTLYIVSSDNLNLYNEQIKNLGEPTDDTDATNKKYVDNLSVVITERINNIKIPENISELSNDVGFSKITIDSGDSEKLNIIHISQDAYHELVINENIDNNSLYIVSSDSLNMYGEQIKNLADGEISSDAVNLGQVSSLIDIEKNRAIDSENSILQTLSETNSELNNKIDNKVLIDGLSTENFEVKHISQNEYHTLVKDNNVLSNVIYVVSSDEMNMYNERIINVADAISSNDAVNLKQLKELTEKPSEKTIFTFDDNSQLSISFNNKIDLNDMINVGFFDESTQTWNKNIKYVDIGSTITNIGLCAFISCDNLLEVKIPNSVISVENQAFAYCSNLKKASLPDSVNYIGTSIYANCSSLVEAYIPNRLKKIPSSTFHECKTLSSLIIPDNIEVIEKYAIDKCINISQLIIPESVKYIGEHTFRDCSCLTSITLKDGLETISDSAFNRCIGLSSINIPKTIKSIEKNAFTGCKNLLSIIFNEQNIKDVAELSAACGGSWGRPWSTIYTFNNASKEWVELYSESTTIKTTDNQKLICEDFKDRLTVTQINKIDKNIIKDVYLGTSLTCIGQYAFSGCKSLEHIEIPSSINTIEPYTFASCDNIYSIDIPGSVKTISEWAFRECYGLQSISLNYGISGLYDCAFGRCTNLKSIKIPESVTYIGSNVFVGCTNLTSIIFENRTLDEVKELNGYPWGISKDSLTSITTKTIDGYDVKFNNKNGLSGIYIGEKTLADTITNISVDGKKTIDLQIINISQDDYHTLVKSGNVLSNAIYVVSSDEMNMYNERITNLADGISANDAVNLNQLCSAISSIVIPEIPTKVSVFENDANYTKISVDNNSTTEFSIEHISQDDYHKIVVDKTIDNNKLYIVSSDNINAYGEKIINVAEPENENDATNKKYVDEKLSEINFKSSVYIGDQVSNLKIVHLSRDDYYNLVVNKQTETSVLYIISSENLNVYNEKITNVLSGEDDLDATNVGQVKSYINELSNSLITNDNIISAKISEKIVIDGINEETLNIKHISQDEYHGLVKDNQTSSNTLYIVSSDVNNMYNERITNIAEPKEENDAATKKYVDERFTKFFQKTENGAIINISDDYQLIIDKNGNINVNIKES